MIGHDHGKHFSAPVCPPTDPIVRAFPVAERSPSRAGASGVEPAQLMATRPRVTKGTAVVPPPLGTVEAEVEMWVFDSSSTEENAGTPWSLL